MTDAKLRRQAAIRIITQRGWGTAKMLASTCGVHRNTAHRDLKTLVDAGTLSRLGKGSETYYILADPPIVDPPDKAP